MYKYFYLLAFFLPVFVIPETSGSGLSYPLRSGFTPTDSIPEDQILNNGKIWLNLFYQAENDQFLFSSDFITGSITMHGKIYAGIRMKYDINTDQLLIPSDVGSIIQLNKEMVDSFSLPWKGKTYHFTNLTVDSLPGLKGYVNVLYKGKSALYVKYIKELYHLSNENLDQKFYQKSQVYFVKDSIAYPVTGKRDLFRIMESEKLKIKDYISKNRIEVSKWDPESFVPGVRYFDSLIK